VVPAQIVNYQPLILQRYYRFIRLFVVQTRIHPCFVTDQEREPDLLDNPKLQYDTCWITDVGFWGVLYIVMTDNYFARYLPLLIHFTVACLLAAAIVTLSYLVGQHKANKSKMSPYECGMEPIGDVRQRFSVKFYLVGMLFILFDVEAVFLYPWAILLKKLKMFGFWEMMTYVLIILVGFFYVWQKGVLDWNKSSRDEAL